MTLDEIYSLLYDAEAEELRYTHPNGWACTTENRLWPELHRLDPTRALYGPERLPRPDLVFPAMRWAHERQPELVLQLDAPPLDALCRRCPQLQLTVDYRKATHHWDTRCYQAEPPRSETWWAPWFNRDGQRMPPALWGLIERLCRDASHYINTLAGEVELVVAELDALQEGSR